MSLDQDDNILVGAGTGGSTQGANVATDYNSSTESHYQLFKQAFGKDGDFIAIGDGADAGSRPLPTKLFQDNGTALSAETLAAGLSVLNVNLRGTSGSGNIPVDINAQTLGVIRVEGKTGGTPMGVCGDNFQIRTLFGATAGYTGNYVNGEANNDSVGVQGISGGHPIGITTADGPFDIRALTSTDQITVAGGTLDAIISAGITINAGGSLDILSASGVTGFGTGTAPALADAPGMTKGLPVLLYGSSGGTAAAIGMSGDALKVALQQTLTAQGSFTATVDNPKAAGFSQGAHTGNTYSPLLVDADVTGNTLGFPALLYGSSGGTAVGLQVSGGALVTVMSGALQASISSVSVDVPKAMGYTSGPGGSVAGTFGNTAGTLQLSDPDVTGNTMATPVLMYGASGYTAVALGITQAGHEGALLVHGDMKVNTSAANPLHITSGANHLAVDVLGIPSVSVSGITNTVVVSAAGMGITIAGGTLDKVYVQGSTLSGGTLDVLMGGTLDAVYVQGGTLSGGTLDAVFVQGSTLSGGTLDTIMGGTLDNVTIFGGFTGFAVTGGIQDGQTETTAGSPRPLTFGPKVNGVTQTGLPVMMYGASADGTAIAVGVSGDAMKVAIDKDLTVTISGESTVAGTVEVQPDPGNPIHIDIPGSIFTSLNDNALPAGATLHAFGLTGGYDNTFGLTSGGTLGSGVMVTGYSGAGTPVLVDDYHGTRALEGISAGVLEKTVKSLWQRNSVNGEPLTTPLNSSLWDKVDEVNTTIEDISIPDIRNLVTNNSLTVATSPLHDSNETTVHGEDIVSGNERYRVEVADIRLPNASIPAFGNTAGKLPANIATEVETGFQLTSHKLTKGVNVKNTSATGIIHVAFTQADAAAGSGYRLHGLEEVYIETDNLSNLFVASCPGASGCYIGG